MRFHDLKAPQIKVCCIPFSVQNGNSSFQNGKIIISINIKKYFMIILAIKLLTFYNIKKNSSSHLLEHNIF